MGIILPKVYAPLILEFKPMSEWRKEDDYDTLLVYLPGFEDIKVTTEDLNIVRVRGERWTDDGNVSQVNEDYRVPENCEMGGIRSRLDGGILTITMPRKIVNTPPPPTTTTATQVPPETDEQTLPPKPKEEEQKEKKPVDKPTLPPQPDKPDKKALIEPQINPLEDNTSPPQQMPTSSYTPTKQEPLKEAKEVNGEFAFGSLPAANVPKKDKHNGVEKPNVAEKTWLDAGEGVHALLEEMSKNSKDGMGQKNDGFQGDKMEEVVASRGVMNEDRKLLVNVGVGVLVIVALGVQLSYTTGLIGKGK